MKPIAPLLTATHLAKCYRLYSRPIDRFTELLLAKRLHQEFWALNDVNVTLQRGISLGIVGENGAGKSTFLKLIAGVLTPTSGSVEVNGRVASIIELGTGFHPELSGHENLLLGGGMLGFSRRQMETKMPAIEAFSELGAFLDHPLKSYSTGMSMRLSFSLAVSVEPDLLIVDEALAVGDGYFQKKCVDRIRAFQEQGGSLLFCSHALYMVSQVCQDALWLRAGQVEAYGPAARVIAAYEAYLHAKEDRSTEQQRFEPRSGGALQEVWVEGEQQNGTSLAVARGADLIIRVRWSSDCAERRFHLGVGVDRVDNLNCFATTTLKDGLLPFAGRTQYAATIRFPALPLSNGAFRIMVFLLDEHGVHLYDQKAAEPTVAIVGKEKEWGIFYLAHRWDLDERA